MTPELWQRLKPLFHAALKEDIQTRATFVDSACGNDLELKMHLRLLLDAEQQNTSSRDEPLVHLKDFPDNNSLPIISPGIGQTISHYRIIEKLGGGGMGIVYKAKTLPSAGLSRSNFFLTTSPSSQTRSNVFAERHARPLP